MMNNKILNKISGVLSLSRKANSPGGTTGEIKRDLLKAEC
jgi:hypothetical protein